jgi:hypothetical protein
MSADAVAIRSRLRIIAWMPNGIASNGLFMCRRSAFSFSSYSSIAASAVAGRQDMKSRKLL